MDGVVEVREEGSQGLLEERVFMAGFVCLSNVSSFVHRFVWQRAQGVPVFFMSITNNDRLLLLACFFSSFSCLIYFRCK